MSGILGPLCLINKRFSEPGVHHYVKYLFGPKFHAIRFSGTWSPDCRQFQKVFDRLCILPGFPMLSLGVAQHNNEKPLVIIGGLDPFETVGLGFCVVRLFEFHIILNS